MFHIFYYYIKIIKFVITKVGIYEDMFSTMIAALGCFSH